MKYEVLPNFLVNGWSDIGFQKTQWTNTSRWHCTTNHHRLWKLNTELQATWAMSFFTLPSTVAKFLDTSVCGGSWCLDPSLSPFLVKFTQILESILLDNPHTAAVLSVGCASFSSTLFPFTPLSVNMLGYSTLWTASCFGNYFFVAYPPCEGCQWLSSGQLPDKQSSPWLCSLVNVSGYSLNPCSLNREWDAVLNASGTPTTWPMSEPI